MFSSAERKQMIRGYASRLPGCARRPARLWALVLVVLGLSVGAASDRASAATRAVVGTEGPRPAGDVCPPVIRVGDIYAADALGRETHWRVTADAAADPTATLRGRARAVIAAPGPGQRLMLSGWVRDESGLASVTCDGRLATTRPASRDELTALGWLSGSAFEVEVAAKASTIVEVTVTAADLAANTSQVKVELRADGQPGPEVLVLEPSPTRGIRVSANAQGPERLVRVYGFARGSAAIVRVAVDGQPVSTKEATADELSGIGWKTPALRFEARVSPSSMEPLRSAIVEALDAAGVRAVVRIPVWDAGRRALVTVLPEQSTYRVGEHVRFTLSSDMDAYVYLLHAEPNGGLSVFLPNPVEPDCLLRGGTPRLFPSRAKEAKWGARYGLVAQEPAGLDRVYCLALPRPLPPTTAEQLSSPDAVARALRDVGPAESTDTLSTSATGPPDVARLAAAAGGSWQVVSYEVRR